MKDLKDTVGYMLDTDRMVLYQWGKTSKKTIEFAFSYNHYPLLSVKTEKCFSHPENWGIAFRATSTGAEIFTELDGPFQWIAQGNPSKESIEHFANRPIADTSPA